MRRRDGERRAAAAEAQRHGFTCEVIDEPMTGGDDRWNLPRFVCGRDWSSPDGLEALLADVGTACR